MPEENQREEENKDEMEEDTAQSSELEKIEITQNEQKLTAKELGLKIYTNKTTGWPKHTLTLKEVTDKLKEGKCKYSYTYAEIDESEMMKLLHRNITRMFQNCRRWSLPKNKIWAARRSHAAEETCGKKKKRHY